MQRNYILSLLLALFLCIQAPNLSIRASTASPRTAGITVSGTVSDQTIKKLYLFSAYDEQNSYVLPIDSIPIANNKFYYKNDTLRTQLFFILPAIDKAKQKPTFQQGQYVFLTNGNNLLNVSKEENDRLKIDIADSKIQTLYTDFTKKKDSIGNKRVLDSLDQAFYEALHKNDTRETQRIKTSSAPIYEQAYNRLRTWLDKQIELYNKTAFGLYLLYTYRIQHNKISSYQEIQQVRKQLDAYDAAAKQTHYYDLIVRKLDAMERTSVGQMAPDIEGTDKDGKAIRLKEFEGKYVLVDFWSSSCTWCRKETPNLLKTYNAFKDRNFTILGVSTDFRKADWQKAIAEDGAIWNHLLLQKEHRNSVLSAYSIISIPEILLIDPHGKIIAKGLRGEQIYQSVKAALQP